MPGSRARRHNIGTTRESEGGGGAGGGRTGRGGPRPPAARWVVDEPSHGGKTAGRPSDKQGGRRFGADAWQRGAPVHYMRGCRRSPLIPPPSPAVAPRSFRPWRWAGRWGTHLGAPRRGGRCRRGATQAARRPAWRQGVEVESAGWDGEGEEERRCRVASVVSVACGRLVGRGAMPDWE